MLREATITIRIESECTKSCPFYDDWHCYLFDTNLDAYEHGIKKGSPKPTNECRKVNDLITQEELQMKYRSGYWSIY